MNHITVENAVNSVLKRKDKNCTINLPFPIRFIDMNKKEKITKSIPLKFFINAMTLTNLKHSELEDSPVPVSSENIVSFYLFGSSVHPKYTEVKKRYLFGLYETIKEERVVPNDIDLLCFVNNTYDISHIKSMSTWTRTISGGYGDSDYEEYCNFDINFLPVHQANSNYAGDRDFLDHIINHGVCLMGDNILKSKRYAIWEHDTIKDTIKCNVTKCANVTEEELKTKEEINRFEMMDLSDE
jgi:hypothetical protein